jgi:MFS family permease
MSRAVDRDAGQRVAEEDRRFAITPPLAVDYLLGNVGQYSLVPVLGVLIATQDRRAGPAAVGVGLFIYFAAVGMSCLLVNRWLPRFRYTTALCSSSLLAAMGFGLIAYIHSFAGLFVLLLVAGLGVSVHLMLGRVLIAEYTADDVERNKAFSTMNIAANVAGALGPFIASSLYVSGNAQPLLSVVAVCYLLGAAVLLTRLPKALRPAGQRPMPAANGWPVSRASLAAVLRHRETRHTVLVATLATFVYAQFYSAFALLVAHKVTEPLLRAVFLSAPAVAIVVFQPAVAAVVNRLLRQGVRPLALLGAATVVFGVAVVALGSGLPLVAACFVTIALFSVAEMVFTPMLNTAFAGLAVGSRLEALNFRQVCWTCGEALGSLCGGTVFLLLADRGLDRFYWLVLGSCAILISLLLVSSRNRASLR